MLTKDVSDELKAIFASLDAQGKEPSVALVKHRLSTSVPMPALINAIRSWKSQAKVPKVEVAQPEPEIQSSEQRIAALETQVAELITRLEALETQLAGKAQ